MSYNSKNHAEQGGEKTVIGGELEILSGGKIKVNAGELEILSGGKIKVNAGATVEGLQRSAYVLPAATAEALGGVKKAAAQADSIAEDAAGLVTDFNALLAKLRTAGILSAE